MDEILQACAMMELDGGTAESGLPEWIHVMKSGTFTLVDGRGPFTLKDPQKVIEASRRQLVDLVVDRDHQIQYAPKGTSIPAAGWIKEMQSRDTGIWARVEWTRQAASQIREKEYRYISPVFFFNKETGEVTKITHATLTHDPAMDLMAVASANRQTPTTKETTMDKHLMAIAAALALGNVTDPQAVVTAAQERFELAASLEKDLGEVRKTLNLKEGAAGKEIVAAASQLASSSVDIDPSKYVPMEAHQALASQLSELQKTVQGDKVEIAVAAATKAGKIAPAQKDWAVAYASKDLAGFEKFVEGAPVIVDGGASAAASRKEGEGSKLTDEERAIASQLGLTEEEYRKGEEKAA